MALRHWLPRPQRNVHQQQVRGGRRGRLMGGWADGLMGGGGQGGGGMGDSGGGEGGGERGTHC